MQSLQTEEARSSPLEKSYAAVQIQNYKEPEHLRQTWDVYAWKFLIFLRIDRKIQYPSLATATKSHGHSAFSSPILSPILCYFEANHKFAISGLSWKPGSATY